MLDTLVLFAAEAAGHEETSKTPFYLAGAILAGWGVLLAAFGMSKADWPNGDGPARGVMAVSAILVLATMAASIATG